MDLLLYLVTKDKLDIHAVSLARLAGEYWEYVKMLRALDLNVESSYLVVFACLLEIKSRLLLPPEPEPEMYDGFDLGDTEEYDLVDRLKEYKKFKEASLHLHVREREARLVFPRPASEEKVEPTSADVSLPDLLEALRGVLEEHNKRQRKRPDIRLKKVAVSVPQRMKELLERLQPGVQVEFRDLFADEGSREHVIVTFLAILELARMGRIKVSQEVPQAPILVAMEAADPGELRLEEQLADLERQQQRSAERWSTASEEWSDDEAGSGFALVGSDELALPTLRSQELLGADRTTKE